jgi:hypothetical protein
MTVIRTSQPTCGDENKAFKKWYDGKNTAEYAILLNNETLT